MRMVTEGEWMIQVINQTLFNLGKNNNLNIKLQYFIILISIINQKLNFIIAFYLLNDSCILHLII